MHLASLSRVNFGTRSLKCENSEMGYCFPYSMLCLARLEQRMRPLFFLCFLLPLQYSGPVCHILRLDHNSQQPHNTNLKEQQVRLFLFPYFVPTWQCSVLFCRTQYSVCILRRADKTWPEHRTLMLLFLFPFSLAIASSSLLLSILLI